MKRELSGLTFDGPRLDQAEHVHRELFQVLWQHQLPGRMRSGEDLAVSAEDVHRLLGDTSPDVLEGLV